MRIDFVDSNGYVTNLNSSSINPSSTYQTFEINYSGKFVDGGYGGPCSPGPCNVNDTQITGIMIFLNPGTGGYNGIVDIEWLSIGRSLEYDIRYNQVGYFIGRDKTINIVSDENFSAINFSVLDSNDNTVLSGLTTSASYWSDSNEYVAKANTSSIDTPGTFKFQADDSEIYFNVGSDIYESISEASLKYYYYNRASTSISSTYGENYSRNFGHADTQVYVHSSAASPARPAGTIISSPKGWYDAGDYNKYVVNSGISTYTLLAAYEHYETYFQSKSIHIPETGGNIPDILDEVKWNLDWMLTMQEPLDGGIYHKLTGLHFSGIVMPENYTLDRYVVEKSTTATLNFAGVMAIASRIFADYNSELPGYSATLLNAAKAAYSWAEANPSEYYENPADVSTGQYGDWDNSDEFQWAAVELFISTGDVQYKNDINLSSIGNGVPSWQYTDPLALISITHYESLLSSDIDTNAAKSLLLNTANALKTQVETSTMNIAMGQTNYDYGWGSNGTAANQILILIRGYEITDDDTYLNAAFTAMDYLLGRNGTGYCYVTGFGDNPTMNPHHRISEADAVTQPVPGMLAGGPNPYQEDGCVGYPNNSNAGSYLDDWCSYASNEVTINWNAPLAYALNALQYYQDQDETLGLDNPIEFNKSIRVYPNPTKNFVQVFGLEGTKHYRIYNILGIEVKNGTITDNKKISIQNLTNGLYFLSFEDRNTIKLIKK